MHEAVQSYFDHLETQLGQHARPSADFYESVDKGDGRLEQRRCWVVQSLDWLEGRTSWSGLCSLIKLESSLEVLATGQRSTEVRYYISSLDEPAQSIEHKIRRHWEIENKLHWTLDVSFGEDASSIHNENAAQNFSLLRKIAMTLLRKNTSKGSIKGKRKKAGWDNDFLLAVIFSANPK